MKELSVEEKAKRYDEALQRTRRWYDSNTNEGYRAIFEEIFPELKESEDERIRKEIIDFIYDKTDTYELREKSNSWLAWLEKQSEHAKFRDSIQIGDQVTKNQDGVLVNMSQLKRVAKSAESKKHDVCNNCEQQGSCVSPCPMKLVEKQGEQKPVDKIELKFKVSNWVVNTIGDTNQIVKVWDDGYTLDDNTFISNSWATEHYHIWTIQDAKNGDVLVCPKYAGDIIPNIFIFKNIERKDNDVFCHCSFLEKFRTEGYVANADPINTDFYPATKEQRDLLFQKMKEAGYEWDADKKELKKIEQKPWSEEDEDILNTIINHFKVDIGCTDEDDIVRWLKSLKDRVQQQPKQVWKPSDEQMKALQEAIIEMGKSVSPCSIEEFHEIQSLYCDLKKLKEE